eukprot:CAMPEP_0201538142 /NCGR_PEP_ID=MMETSP0161_2-20130828/66797_1 /ASSEMBLY_ACC=CAM_ASM_000251 /TAXON_ID=180227 /ORGANISM="Neoparamoeba aestuarina, Strain SoJaBio B1-5/56/2" /LENGTH=107 /DNA_ID=CAMNT_0047944835 /DNA_START=40 /DNA_END=359 /DNA_ORIENTATION=+
MAWLAEGSYTVLMGRGENGWLPWKEKGGNWDCMVVRDEWIDHYAQHHIITKGAEGLEKEELKRALKQTRRGWRQQHQLEIREREKREQREEKETEAQRIEARDAAAS